MTVAAAKPKAHRGYKRKASVGHGKAAKKPRQAKAPKKAKPAQAGMSRYQALRLLSPWTNSYPPQDGGEGHFTMTTIPINTTQSVPAANNGTYILVVPSGSTAHRLFGWKADGTFVTQGYLNAIYGGTMPTQIRALRAGLRLRNFTKADNVEGLVKVAMLSTPLEIEWSSASDNSMTVTSGFITELSNIVTNNQDVRTYSASSLCGGKEWIFPAATRIGMMSYKKYIFPATTADTKAALVADDLAMSLCTMLIKIEDVTVEQNYSLSYLEQTACRFPGQTLLNQLGRSVTSKQKPQLDAANDVLMQAPASDTAASSFGPMMSGLGRSGPYTVISQ